MPSTTRTTALGWITTGPTLTLDATGSPECRFTLVVSGQALVVAASSAHGRWLATTVTSGMVAQVEGVVQAGEDGSVLQAVMVDVVPRAASVP